MATAEQLERALVNAHKAGDTQAATILAGELKQMRAEASKDVLPDGRRIAPQEAFDQLSAEEGGMGRFLSGIGLGMTAPVVGGRQAVGADKPGQVEEHFRMKDASDKSWQGKSGQAVGGAAALLPTVLFPWASTVLGAGTVGAGFGALQPTRKDESRLNNTVMGGVFGAAVPAAIATARMAKSALIDPFTKGGQEGIAGRVLSRFATNKDAAVNAARNPAQIVPGSRPTLAEATLDPGLATLQTTLRSADPVMAKGALIQRGQENSAARLASLRAISGTAKDLSEAEAKRAAVAGQLYEKAFDTGFDAAKVTPSVQKNIETLLKRPSIGNVRAKAIELAKEQGIELTDETSLIGLHYSKLALDDLIGAAKGNEQRALLGTKELLVNTMDELSPLYKAARKTFESMSKPVNTMQVGQRLYDKSTRALMEGTEAQKLYGDKFANLLRDEIQTVKNATGFRGNKGLRSVMTDPEIKALNAIKKDLAREAQASGLGAAAGSPTAQNLVGRDILEQIAGPVGLPRGWMGSSLVENFLSRPLSLLNGVPERNIRGLLADAMVNPAYGAALMGRQPGTVGILTDRLANVAGRAGLLGSPAAYDMTQ